MWYKKKYEYYGNVYIYIVHLGSPLRFSDSLISNITCAATYRQQMTVNKNNRPSAELNI